MCNLHCETESARGVSVSEAGVERGAATFLATYNTTEIVFLLHEICLQHTRPGIRIGL